jgi:TonB family protein
MMGTFFAWSLKSALCLAVFYLFYKPLLSSETFHRFNRLTLLCLMAFSLCIPLLAVFFAHISESGMTEPIPFGPAETYLSGQPEAPAPVPLPSGGNKLLGAALLIYLTGCCVFILHVAHSLYGILRTIRKSKCTLLDGRIRLAVHSDNSMAPFSWMNCIVMFENDLDEAGEVIIMHEQAHIRQYHSVDLVFAELCLLFQWYNPAAWLLYNELQSIHEYEADRYVIDKGIHAKQYQLLLIKKAVGTKLYSMANSFNHSNLKKRITMMLQKNSSSWARLKYAYVLPLAAVAIAAFARPEIARPFDGVSSAKVSHFVLTDNPFEAENAVETAPAEPSVTLFETDAVAPPDTTVYMVVEAAPEFPGGQNALLSFVSDNLVYPEKAKNDGVQGRVVASFIVWSDGKIRDVKVERGISPELDAEAIRIVKAMPAWKPGRQNGKDVPVKYALPVNFKFDGSKNVSEAMPSAPPPPPPAVLGGNEASEAMPPRASQEKKQAKEPRKIESEQLEKESAQLEKESEQLRKESEQLEEESAQLRKDGEQISKDVDKLRKEGDQLRKEGDKLRKKADQLRKEKDQVREEADQLRKEGDQLTIDK